jgi:hypothetical protein
LGIGRKVVNYHLRVLEKAGMLAFVDERQKGGLMERRLQAKAKSYLISPEALGAVEPDPKRIRDRLSWGYLVAAAAKVIRDLGILRQRADLVGKRLPTFTLETEVRIASAADRDAFTQELSASIAALAVKYHTEHAPHGRLFRFVLGAYPAITKTEAEAAQEAAQVRKDCCHERCDEACVPVIRKAVRGACTAGRRLESNYRGRRAHALVLPGGDRRARRWRQANG